MSQHAARRRRRYVGWVPFLLVLGGILGLAAGGITWVDKTYGQRPPSITTAVARNVGTVPDSPRSTAKAITTMAELSPRMIEIPSLGTTAPIINVGTLPGGALDVPLNPRTVGWWDGGAQPGAAKGTAVLAGHINYAGVEGALARINELNPGDKVYVDGITNGHATRLTFTVTGVRTYAKSNLPYQQIFDQDTAGRLAIVTCGGPFDAQTGNYLDNIVAYAVLA